MDFVNSSYYAAATFLPYALPLSKSQSGSYQHDLTPSVITISPWQIFEHLWTSVVGCPTKDFRWTPHQTPMATFKETAIFIASYYLVVFGGREVMRNRPAFKLNKLFIIHNFYLTVISGGLLACFIEQLVPTLWKNGLFDGVCGGSGWTQPLLVLYYLNYLTKYLELLDTVFLVLKKKPLTFLHTYHHGATALLCYTQLVGETSVSWVPITLNLTVHVVMYWYYFQSARGIRVWWKQYITMLQISQFVLDLGFIYFAVYTYVADEYLPQLPHVGSCGDPKQELAAFSGCAIISSYLVLFIAFYLSTYKKSVKTVTNLEHATKKASKKEVPAMAESTEKAADALRSATNVLVHTITEDKCLPNQ